MTSEKQTGYEDLTPMAQQIVELKEKVARLEQQRDEARAEIDVHKAFHKVAISERNLAWHNEDALKKERLDLIRQRDELLEAASAAHDDIREHLQVCKYNLRGQINTGEIIEKPNPPQLVHEAGIAASERVLKQLETAIAAVKGNQ